jgi:heparan-alpha-glucosaminide N-acetyltransferase
METMTNYNRITSIDIMRGLTILLMLFVNDLNMDKVPAWLGHMEADFDGMGLADWVFPGFLFIVGMAIPFSISKRLSAGDGTKQISRHILTRTISLIIIGVLMLNSGRVNPELTGMSRNLWALLIYLGVFLTWNDYADKENRFFTVTGFRLFGIAILCFLVFKFRSGHLVNNGSLITGWWGILGLIGWGYLVSAFAYFFFRDSILKTSLLALLFLVLNILTGLNILKIKGVIDMVFGIVIQGNVPFLVLTGLVAGLILRKVQGEGYRKIILLFVPIAMICVLSGFILRHWFIISKIKATPSWGLICSGISFIVFIIIYFIADVKKITAWAAFMRPAGQNALTTYLAPDILYYLIWISGVPVLIYKESSSALLVIAGSIAWALLMAGLMAILVRLNIKLKI